MGVAASKATVTDAACAVRDAAGIARRKVHVRLCGEDFLKKRNSFSARVVHRLCC